MIVKSIKLKDDDEIIPGQSLGGIQLGQRLEDIEIDRSAFKVVNGNKVGCVMNGAIYISLSLDGLVIQLAALEGYKGKLLGQYVVGQSVKSILVDSEWEFTEMEEGFINRSLPGVTLYPNLEDARPQEIKSMAESLIISEISIYEPT